MEPNQSLAPLLARLLTRIDIALSELRPDMVLAQGDTSTVLATALAAFYRHIPFGHVEAGLRTGNLRSPFPEEGNRVLTSPLAALHFAPTQAAAENLRHEGIADTQIIITGNTVIDALFMELAAATPAGSASSSIAARMRERIGADFGHAAVCAGDGPSPRKLWRRLRPDLRRAGDARRRDFPIICSCIRCI